MLILQVGPEWRNWQTQQTQNLPELCSVWVRLPPPGPSYSFVENSSYGPLVIRLLVDFWHICHRESCDA